jgi:hypothetical protein
MIVLHIETRPYSAERLLAGVEITPAANLKDPAKIKEDIEKRRQRYIEDAYLSENTAQVGAIAYKSLFSDDLRVAIDEDGTEEETLLREVYDKIKDTNTITFRGTKLVYPFLMRRGLRYGINFVPVFYKDADLTGRLGENHVDIARAWACNSLSHPEKIDEIISVLGFSKPLLNPVIRFHKLLENDTASATQYMEQMLTTIEEIYTRLIQ